NSLPLKTLVNYTKLVSLCQRNICGSCLWDNGETVLPGFKGHSDDIPISRGFRYCGRQNLVLILLCSRFCTHTRTLSLSHTCTRTQPGTHICPRMSVRIYFVYLHCLTLIL